MRDQFAKFLEKLFLVRVPVVGWFVLLFLGYALQGQSLGIGFLYIETPPRIVTIAMGAMLASAACLMSFHLIGWVATHRYKAGIRVRHPLPWFLLAFVPPSTLIWSITGPPGKWLYALLGVFIALHVIGIAEMLRLALSDAPKSGTPQPLSLLYPSENLGPRLRGLRARQPKGFVATSRNFILARFAWPLSFLGPFLKPGYFEDDVRPLHAAAASIQVVTLALYVALGSSYWWGFEPLPAIAWILLFLTLAVWTFAGLTVFFDKFRVPVLLTAILVSLATSNVPESDHFYQSEPLKSWQRPTAKQFVDARKSKRIIVVSAPGGGIQSAAWTTYVLKALQKETDGKFLQKTALISSVSGGSVGIFHLAAQDFNAAQAYESATRSSIDDVAWGWLYPDTLRALFPWMWKDLWLDRGWALERSIERNAGAKRPFLQDIPVNNVTPALIINTTAMERGQPVVFSTTEFSGAIPKTRPPCGPAIPNDDSTDPWDHWDLYHRKVRLSTAARLSAGFPFVSPASRTLAEEPNCGDLHLLDGGYYDNYGMYSLTKWTHAATQGSKDWEILLVRILAFPESAKDFKVVGWGMQSQAPVNGVLATRETSQWIIGKYMTELSGVGVTQADFRYDAKTGCEKAPLNWVLTAKEKGCIESQPLNSQALARVKDFVDRKEPPQ